MAIEPKAQPSQSAGPPPPPPQGQPSAAQMDDMIARMQNASSLPDALMDWIDQKTAAYSNKRANAKSADQFRAALIIQNGNRLMDVRYKLFKPFNEEDVLNIVVKNVGKRDSDLQASIIEWNLKLHMKVEKQAEVSAIAAITQERANQTITTLINDQRAFMERVMDKLDNITRIASSGGNNGGAPPSQIESPPQKDPTDPKEPKN